ncbi:hypothetical protein Salat_2549000 [Sesamum alatum]|uniref:Uncharacterized protein n=1 Tax=Sesamum alatum TaxID=300844 RepID=A0AAE1XSI0_9LAMI|nr:hypothetical protein Salat_2549000 [Sesamum alatum]
MNAGLKHPRFREFSHLLIQISGLVFIGLNLLSSLGMQEQFLGNSSFNPAAAAKLMLQCCCCSCKIHSAATNNASNATRTTSLKILNCWCCRNFVDATSEPKRPYRESLVPRPPFCTVNLPNLGVVLADLSSATC